MLRSVALAGYAVLASLSLSALAMADDPNDPGMRSKAARDRDRAIIRQLNLKELERVRARDARYAKDWDAYRAYHGDDARTLPRCRGANDTHCRR
jgi:hypothetical protein